MDDPDCAEKSHRITRMSVSYADPAHWRLSSVRAAVMVLAALAGHLIIFRALGMQHATSRA